MTDPRGGFGSFHKQASEEPFFGLDPRPSRILTGAAFIADHVPPVWLIDGIVQRSRLYACTSRTGHGKTAVWLFNACMIRSGRQIGHLDTFRGNVLILAGENPSDLKARMIGMAKAYNLPLDRLPYVLPGSFPMNEDEADALKRDIAALGVPLVLIVGDTASSFFPGDDENSNVQSGTYARTLRSFTTDCDGEPAIIVLCHPTKEADRRSLLPRGVIAFLNELDGNLTLWSLSQGEVTEMHWCGKIRGPDFSPLGYQLRQVPTGLLDEKDRPEITIIAEPMSEEAIADHSKQTLANEDGVLRTLRDHPEWSLGQIAREHGWLKGDKPERWKVKRAIDALAADKLIQKPRQGAAWEITDKGDGVIAKYAKPPRASGPDTAAAPEPRILEPAPPPPAPTKAEVDAAVDSFLALDEVEQALQSVPTANSLNMPLGHFRTVVRVALKAKKAAEAMTAKPKPTAAKPKAQQPKAKRRGGTAKARAVASAIARAKRQRRKMAREEKPAGSGG